MGRLGSNTVVIEAPLDGFIAMNHPYPHPELLEGKNNIN
jgi:hypothetical protein